MGSELSCTPGKPGGGGGTGERENGGARVSPRSLNFLFVNFSPALYYLNAWNRLHKEMVFVANRSNVIDQYLGIGEPLRE